MTKQNDEKTFFNNSIKLNENMLISTTSTILTNSSESSITTSSESLSSESLSSSSLSYLPYTKNQKDIIKKGKKRENKSQKNIINVIVELLSTEKIFIDDLKTVN